MIILQEQRGAFADHPQAFPRAMDPRVEKLVPGLVTSAEWEKEERIHKGGVDVLGTRG